MPAGLCAAARSSWEPAARRTESTCYFSCCNPGEAEWGGGSAGLNKAGREARGREGWEGGLKGNRDARGR